MSQGFIFQAPRLRPVGANGLTLPNSILMFYVTGTTTLTPIYGNSALSSPLPNPIQADGTGMFPVIYLDPTIIYHVQYYDQYNNLQYDADPGADIIETVNDVTIPPTGVVPGTYTSSTITVEADGRLTAASSGSSTPTGSIISLTKSSFTGRTATTSLQLDPDLVATLAPGSYTFQMGLVFSSTASPNGGIVIGLGNNTGTFQAQGMAWQGFSNVLNTFQTLPYNRLTTSSCQFAFTSVTHSVVGATDSLFITGAFTINASSACGLYWAQNTNSSDTISIASASFLNFVSSSLV